MVFIAYILVHLRAWGSKSTQLPSIPLLPKEILFPFSQPYTIMGQILASNAGQKLPAYQESFKKNLTSEETEVQVT